MKARLLTTLLMLFGSLLLSAQDRQFTIADGLHNNQVRQIVELPNGQMLVACEGAFSLYDGHRFQPLPCNLDSLHRLPSFGFHDNLKLDGHTLLLKDYHYLYLFDTDRMQFRYDYDRLLQQPRAKDFETRRERCSATSCTDRQGGQWIPCDSRGITYRSPLPLHATSLDGLPQEDEIRHLLPLDDGTLLMAGAKRLYLYSLGRDEGAGQEHTGALPGQRLSVLPSPTPIQCNNLNRGLEGEVWISSQHGLLRYRNGRMTHYDTGNCSGFLHNHMRFVCILGPKRLLVCNTLHGLGYFYPEERRFELLNRRLPELNDYRTMVDALPLDASGRVLVITQNGLFVLNTRTDSLEHPAYLRGTTHRSNKFNCLLQDSRKRMWIGSQNGLYMLVPQLTRTGEVEDYTLHAFSLTDGLSNTCIKSLTEDSLGNVYVGTAHGVNRISLDKEHFQVVSYGTSDGLPDCEMRERGACLMPGGDLYLATENGVTRFDASQRDTKQARLSVRSTGIWVNGTPRTPRDTLDLPYNQNHITLSYSALNYSNPAHTRYRYRLKGLSDQWVTVGGGEDLVRVSYDALPYGTYCFEIESTIDNQPWGAPTRLPITIHPPLWLTWWAILCYILLVSLAVWKGLDVYLSYRRKAMEAEKEVLINQLFDLQKETRSQFAQHVQIDDAKLKAARCDELVVRINASIAHNMDNVDYTVDDLAREVCMSRATLYKRLHEALGITPNEYLRNVRLKHATTLLEQGIPVNQVSLMVGFMTPRYFSQCFKKLFGVFPSEYVGATKAQE